MRCFAFLAGAGIVLVSFASFVSGGASTPEFDAVAGPSSRAFHDMAYDRASNRIILFGGYHEGHTAETWVYDVDNNTWHDMNPLNAPSGREAYGLAYDAKSALVILFGGYTTDEKDNDETWAYDLNANTWTDMKPTTSPPARLAGRLAYDPRVDRVILFGGGNVNRGLYNDTWAYALGANAWTRRTPATAPPARAYHTMAYDEESGRVVLFGGELYADGPGTNDTWAYDAANDRWAEMTPAVRPIVRANSGVYDSKADQILVFGGATGQETWTYNLNSNVWSELNPAPVPSNRCGSAMAYDAKSDRTILFGGMWPCGFVFASGVIKNGETWVFDLGNNTWKIAPEPLIQDGPPKIELALVSGVLVAVVVGIAVAVLLRRKHKGPSS